MKRMGLGSILVAGMMAGTIAGTPVFAGKAAAANIDGAARLLVPHRAIYDLKLKNASDRSGIEGMFGRMVYEFTGDACTGFTTNFRLVTKIDTGEETRLSDQQTVTVEDLSARKFHFQTKSFTDQQLDRQVDGDATAVTGGAGTDMKVQLKSPNARDIDLPTGVFPTEHMVEVIDNAEKGTKFFQARVFDGSENGDQSLLTTTVIGKEQPPATDDPDAANAGAFSKAPFWPVTIAYFNDSKTGDPTPVYNMSFKLYPNGITRDLTMDYGDFALTGTLSKLELLDKKDCK
jgi:hypothetical protein